MLKRSLFKRARFGRNPGNGVTTSHLFLLDRNLPHCAVATAEWPLLCVYFPMTCHKRIVVRGVFAPLTLVSAVPADVAVTLLHVFVQMILSRTCILAVGAVMQLRFHVFTWGAQGRDVMSNGFWKSSPMVSNLPDALRFTDPLHRVCQCV